MTSVRCLVVEPFHDLGRNARHHPGEILDLDPDRASRWTAQALVRPMPEGAGPDWPWHGPGRELRAPEDTVPAGWFVVACLSVWQDVLALANTLPSWINAVDHLVAVDGITGSPPKGVHVTSWSSDGTREVLLQHADKLTLIDPPVGGWTDQITKRSAYLRLAPTLRPDRPTLLFVVDADELVEGADCLRALPALDVGWVRVRYPELYARHYDQPRLFCAREGLSYSGRHHWVEHRPWAVPVSWPSRVASHQEGGVGWLHRLAPVTVTNAPSRWRSMERQYLRSVLRKAAAAEEVTATRDAGPNRGRETLRVLHLGLIDAGGVAFRLHTAINATTPHSSVQGAGDDNPFAYPQQFNLKADRETLRMAAREADVIHCHVGYQAWDVLGVPLEGRPLVIHHHGTMYRTAPGLRDAQDRARHVALRLASNPDLILRSGDAPPPLVLLPNPVPVAFYRRLRAAVAPGDRWPESGVLRVGHSPSKRERKGTAEFLRVLRRLRLRGVLVEAVLLEHLPHAEAVARKARCDVVFDSFDLGMQCAGIEAGAMGIPVLAGDQRVHGWWRDTMGGVGYTLVEDEAALERRLIEFVEYPAAYEAARDTTTNFVLWYHDEAAVAARYLNLLDEAVQWRRQATARRGRRGTLWP